MRKDLAGGVGVMAALVMVFGSGVANGKPVTWLDGQTYAKAQEQVTWTTLKIVARQGSYLPTEECVIYGARTASGGGGEYLVSLDCNAKLAIGNGHPGGSAASPEGRKMMKWREYAAVYSKNFAQATAAGEESVCAANAKWCTTVCQETGACSPELAEFLGL